MAFSWPCPVLDSSLEAEAAYLDPWDIKGIGGV